MKKLMVIGIALVLVGCASGADPAKLSVQVKQIQGYTKLACSFIPTVATIASILSSGASVPIGIIAQDICTAVTTVPLADGGPRAAKVYGIAIKGKFVK